jgi:hypothetical protein
MQRLEFQDENTQLVALRALKELARASQFNEDGDRK